MRYIYFWDYSADSFPMCLGEYARHDSDNVIAVTYYIELGRIKLYSVEKDGIDILPIINALEATKPLIWMAESHQMKLNVKQQYNNYPHLAKPLTQEEQVEILKLK